jgi:hypothetical protein
MSSVPFSRDSVFGSAFQVTVLLGGTVSWNWLKKLWQSEALLPFFRGPRIAVSKADGVGGNPSWSKTDVF